jgi:hypothetical protein
MCIYIYIYIYIYIKTLLDLGPRVLQKEFELKFFYDFMYFNWDGMVSCSVCFYKNFLWILFANGGPGYNLCSILTNKIRRFVCCVHCEYCLLYYGVLAYRTYKVVVERRLPAECWDVTVAMNVSEDMHRSQSRHLSFSCRITTLLIL